VGHIIWAVLPHCSGAAFFTAPSCLPAPILPLHCTRTPFVGYCSSSRSSPWPPPPPCFKFFQVFQKYVFKYFIWILSMLQWLYTYVSSICFSCFRRMCSSVLSRCCRSISECCITCMLKTYVSSVSGVSYVCLSILSVCYKSRSGCYMRLQWLSSVFWCFATVFRHMLQVF
jgi:hypothetical protein